MSYIKIPTWELGQWTYTIFETKDEYKAYALTLFKEPGKYNFNETSILFTEQADFFRKNGYFYRVLINIDRT